MTSPNDAKVAYGLDLAGYSTGKSALARAEDEGLGGTVRVYVISKHPFVERRKRPDVLDVKPEQDAIKCMLAKARLCVDIPIDLQGLMDRRDAGTRFVWECTLRPVDYAFGALPALADRIGSPVARFRNILTEHQERELGRGLWETYPRAVLERLIGSTPPYKNGRVVFRDRKWTPRPMTEATRHRSEALACIAKRICVTADDGTVINDDDLDAAVCAIAGLAPPSAVLCGHQLEQEVLCHIKKKLKQPEARSVPSRCYPAPRGYLLLRCKYWSKIHLTSPRTEDDRTTPLGVH